MLSVWTLTQCCEGRFKDVTHYSTLIDDYYEGNLKWNSWKINWQFSLLFLFYSSNEKKLNIKPRPKIIMSQLDRQHLNFYFPFNVYLGGYEEENRIKHAITASQSYHHRFPPHLVFVLQNTLRAESELVSLFKYYKCNARPCKRIRDIPSLTPLYSRFLIP